MQNSKRVVSCLSPYYPTSTILDVRFNVYSLLTAQIVGKRRESLFALKDTPLYKPYTDVPPEGVGPL